MWGGLHHGGAARDRPPLRLCRVLQDRPPQGRLPEQARDRPSSRIVSRDFGAEQVSSNYKQFRVFSRMCIMPN